MPSIRWCSCGNDECEDYISLGSNSCGNDSCTVSELCADCRAGQASHVCWTLINQQESLFTAPTQTAARYDIWYLYSQRPPRWEHARHLPPNMLTSVTYGEAVARLEQIARRHDGYEYRIQRISDGEVIERTPDDEFSQGTVRTKMVDIKFLRENGRLMISVNSTGLHEILDGIGVQTETSGSTVRYRDRPYSVEAVANTTNLTLSTEILLVKTYPAKFDLSAVFSRPPSMEALKKLAQSSFEQVRKILEHYQPIDIQVEIQKKVLKELS